MASNRELIEGLYANNTEGDLPAVLALWDPQIEWHEAEGFPLYTGTLFGPQAVVDGVINRVGEIGNNFEAVADQVIAEGDTVVALGTYSWDHKVSGERAQVKMAHVWTFANGKVIRFQQHVDTARVRDLMA